jgi:hypothetical protein
VVCVNENGASARSGGITQQRAETVLAVLKLPLVLLNTALAPMAVLTWPLVSLKRANAPLDALKKMQNTMTTRTGRVVFLRRFMIFPFFPR